MCGNWDQYGNKDSHACPHIRLATGKEAQPNKKVGWGGGSGNSSRAEGRGGGGQRQHGQREGCSEPVGCWRRYSEGMKDVQPIAYDISCQISHV